MQEPKIIETEASKLVGFSMEMTMANNQTGRLWGTFMPRRRELQNLVSDDKYSLQIFGDDFNWYTADEHTKFVKWAAMQVSEDSFIPEGMDVLDLPGGTYAVFVHKGHPSGFPKTLNYILNEWMKNSGYKPDYTRYQFELLGAKYANNDPESEEEIWFPVTNISK